MHENIYHIPKRDADWIKKMEVCKIAERIQTEPDENEEYLPLHPRIKHNVLMPYTSVRTFGVLLRLWANIIILGVIWDALSKIVNF